MEAIDSSQAKIAQPRKEEFVNHQPTRVQIKHRAYQIYLERGARPGNELDDWIRAERELVMVALFT
jgi:hypothetical protein